MKLVPIPLEQIQSGRADTSLTATKHIWNELAVNARPKMLWFGPQGLNRVSNATFDDWNGHIRWPYVDGDQSSTVLEDIAVRPHGFAGVLELRCLFLATHLTDEISGPTPVDNIFELAAQADWTFVFEAQELTNGDTWASPTIAGTTTKVVNLRHFPTDSSGQYPVLQQAYWAQYGVVGNRYAKTFKEGRLRSDDFAFLHPETFRVPFVATNQLLVGGRSPLRFRLEAVRTGTPVFRAPTKGSPLSPIDNNQFLRLQLISCAGVQTAEAPTIEVPS